MDRQGKPVTLFRERISTLIEDLSAGNDVIGIPAPALAETLVRSGPNRAQYMKVLNDSWKFQMVPFDSRAAIEAADLIALGKTNKEQWGTWAKVKFDIQIVAIAKAEGVSVIYSDDQDIENFAKRLKIHVIRICDLPTPQSASTSPIEAASLGPQMDLPLAARETGLAVKTSAPASTGQTSEEDKSTAPPSGAAMVQQSDEPESDSANPTALPGGGDGLAQIEPTTAKEDSAELEVAAEKPTASDEGGLGGSGS
jgi:hypothetical protein